MQDASARQGLIVADDSRLMRDLLRSHLEPAFGEVFLASDGVEAVAIARGLHARLVLLDYRMPRMHGIDACREIRQIAGYAKVPVVLLTAYDDEKARREATRAGATLVVAKPFTPEQLVEAVVPLLRLREVMPAGSGLAQGRDALSLRRRIEAATAQRQYAGFAERAAPMRDFWRR